MRVSQSICGEHLKIADLAFLFRRSENGGLPPKFSPPQKNATLWMIHLHVQAATGVTAQPSRQSIDTPLPSLNMSGKPQRSRVFLDVSLGTEPIGRLVFELYTEKTPKTCEKCVLQPLIHILPGRVLTCVQLSSAMH